MKAGDIVVIKYTQTLEKRHPELIGAIGTITSQALKRSDDSVWFNVEIHKTGKTVKMRAQSLELHKPATSSGDKGVGKNSGATKAQEDEDEPDQKTQKKKRQMTALQSIAAAMTVGSEVKILRTDNTMSRVPHLCGKIGIVHEAPGR